MTKPHYQEIPSEKIPVAQSKDGKVKVIAGQSMGKNAVIAAKTPIMYLHFSLRPGSQVTQEIPNNFNAFAYIAQGQALFGSEQKIAKKDRPYFLKIMGMRSLSLILAMQQNLWNCFCWVEFLLESQ